MTEEEKNIALSFKHVSCLPGTWAKRFLTQTYYSALRNPEKPLTEKQRYWLIQLMHTYRRQIPNTYALYSYLYDKQNANNNTIRTTACSAPGR